MSGKMIVGQDLTQSYDVCNGQYENCTVIPMLLSLYFEAVVDDWRSKCSTAGVVFRYSINLVASWLERGPKSSSYYLMLSLNHSLLMILPCMLGSCKQGIRNID